MTITKTPDPDQGKGAASALAAVQLRKAQLARAEAPAPKSPVPTYEINPRSGGAVLASVMEKRRARARALNNPKQRARRVRTKAEMALMLAGLDCPKPPTADRQTLMAEAKAFRLWLRTDGPRQRQYKPLRVSYWKSRMALLNARLELDGDPGPAEFAARLTAALGTPFDRMKARNRLMQLLKLEGRGGPWFPGAVSE